MKRLLVLAGACTLFALGYGAAVAAPDGAELYKPCAGCHGTDGTKKAMGYAEPVKGQTAAELYKKLKGYADGTYGGDRKALMTNAVKKYSDEELKTLSDYMAKF